MGGASLNIGVTGHAPKTQKRCSSSVTSGIKLTPIFSSHSFPREQATADKMERKEGPFYGLVSSALVWGVVCFRLTFFTIAIYVLLGNIET